MKKSAIALLCAASVVLTGCGEDEKDNADAPASLTKAEFVEQANELCKTNAEEFEDAMGSVRSEAQFDAFMKKTGVPLMRKLADQIEALEEPADLSGAVDAMLASLRADINKVAENPDVLMDDSLFVDGNKKAKKLGLDECAD